MGKARLVSPSDTVALLVSASISASSDEYSTETLMFCRVQTTSSGEVVCALVIVKSLVAP